jgi:phage major head subunit gpT-like protein
MREWIGARQAQTTAQRSYSDPQPAVRVDAGRPAADARPGQERPAQAYVGNFAAGCVANHWEDLVVALINTNGLCYDGQNFFDTDHAVRVGDGDEERLTSDRGARAGRDDHDRPDRDGVVGGDHGRRRRT